MNLREQFERETSLKWKCEYSDGVHCTLIDAPSYKYIEWLEMKLNKQEE